MSRLFGKDGAPPNHIAHDAGPRAALSAGTKRVQKAMLGTHLVVFAIFCCAVDPFDLSTLRRLLALGMRESPSEFAPTDVAIAFLMAFIFAVSVPVGLLISALMKRHTPSTIASVAVSAGTVSGIVAIAMVYNSNQLSAFPLLTLASITGSIGGSLLSRALQSKVLRSAESMARATANTSVSHAGTTFSRRRLVDEYFDRDYHRMWLRLRRWYRRLVASIAGVVLATVSVAIPVYVAVPQGDEEPSDAVVVLGPIDDTRLAAANDLIAAGVSSTLVISSASTGDGEFATDECRASGAIDVICFKAKPFTTAGEIEAIAAYGKDLGWSRVTLMTSTPHVARVKVIADLCLPFEQTVIHVESPRSINGWILAFVYQTFAFAKMATHEPC